MRNDRQVVTAHRLVHDYNHLQSCCRRPVRIPSFYESFMSFTHYDRGWDQTGSNGANLSFPQVFHINNDSSDPHAAKNQWIVGVINAGYAASSPLL
jgi:hypothetical protein